MLDQKAYTDKKGRTVIKLLPSSEFEDVYTDQYEESIIQKENGDLIVVLKPIKKALPKSFYQGDTLYQVVKTERGKNIVELLPKQGFEGDYTDKFEETIYQTDDG